MSPLRLLLVLGAATGAVAAVGLALPSPADALAVLPWALVLGGPAALWLAQPALARDGRAWARVTALALPGVAAAAATRETLRVLARVPPPAFEARHAAIAIVHLVWLAATLGLAARAVSKLRRGDRWSAAGFAGSALVAALVANLMPLLLLVEAAALLALARFERSAAQWGRAAAVGSSVLLVGGAGLWAAKGGPWPPRVAVDEMTFGLGVVPLIAAAGVAFVATLLLPGRAPDVAPSDA